MKILLGYVYTELCSPPKEKPNLMNSRNFLNTQPYSVLYEYNQQKFSLYNDWIGRYI